jgi:hypothetical protein
MSFEYILVDRKCGLAKSEMYYFLAAIEALLDKFVNLKRSREVKLASLRREKSAI